MRTISFISAGVALAALLAGPIAQAATGQVSAEITGLKLELIDLLPNDEFAPKITFSSPNYNMWAALNDERGWEFGETKLVHHKGSIQVARPYGGTTGLITADLSRSITQLWSQDGQVNGSLYSWTDHTLNFALEYGTAVKVTAIGTLAATNPDGVPQWASVELRGSMMTQGEGPTDKFEQVFSLEQGTGTFELSGYLYSTEENGGYIQLLTSTSMNTVAAPVPEPESYAMLLAGLGLLALRGRKARR